MATLEAHLEHLPEVPFKGFPAHEPEAPSMKTVVPGPKSKELMARLNKLSDGRHVYFFQDDEHSVGNYIADADGNMILDVYNHISSIALGYNHPYLQQLAESPRMKRLICQRPATGVMPFLDWPDMLENIFLSVKPHPELSEVFTCHTGSDSNEFAFKTAMMYKAQKLRVGGVIKDPAYNPFTAEDNASAMLNMPPGCPELSILSFEGAFHGRTFGALSATRSKAIHKLDIAAFKWPVAPFPKHKYPIESHEAENRAEDDRCLAALDKILTEDKNVAAVIIEPVQAEGGDRHVSPHFAQGIRDITAKHDVCFIVDEVQCGVMTGGNFWMHQNWNLKTPPDMMTFSKKAQAAGFYFKPHLLPSHAYRNFNTWMGDPVRALVFGEVVRVAKEPGCAETIRITGEYLQKGLKLLCEKYPKLVMNTRGQGTFCAFDFDTADHRNAFVAAMRNHGVNVGGCGEQSLRLRPTLNFLPKHAAILLKTASAVLAELK